MVRRYSFDARVSCASGCILRRAVVCYFISIKHAHYLEYAAADSRVRCQEKTPEAAAFHTHGVPFSAASSSFLALTTPMITAKDSD